MGVFLLVDDFVALALVFFLVECLVALWEGFFVVGAAFVGAVAGSAGAGAALSGAVVGAGPAACALAPVGTVLAARKARTANTEISVFIGGSWTEITIRRFCRTCKECGQALPSHQLQPRITVGCYHKISNLDKNYRRNATRLQVSAAGVRPVAAPSSARRQKDGRRAMFDKKTAAGVAAAVAGFSVENPGSR